MCTFLGLSSICITALIGDIMYIKVYLGEVKSVAPQVLQQLLGFGAHFGGVHLGEFFKGETPSVKSGTETHGSVLGADLFKW